MCTAKCQNHDPAEEYIESKVLVLVSVHVREPWLLLCIAEHEQERIHLQAPYA